MAYGHAVTALRSRGAQEWMEHHALPSTVPANGLLPATIYAVSPAGAALEAYGVSRHEAMQLNAAFFVTPEMMESLRVLVTTLNAAGFEENTIGLDIDGKHKYARNGWVLISYGGR